MKARPIRIEGDLAYITLTKGYEAVIDAVDVPLVEGFNWYAQLAPRTVYAVRFISTVPIKKRVPRHRVIMGDPEGLEVDHTDCNGLNNRRINLRAATPSQNMRNVRITQANTSGFKGVCWDKLKKCWRSSIRTHGKLMHLGYHGTPELAHAAYCEASVRLHGEFGRND